MCICSTQHWERLGLFCFQLEKRFILQKSGSFCKVAVRRAMIMIRVERETNKNAHIKLTDI
jgi:hypothetical protein